MSKIFRVYFDDIEEYTYAICSSIERAQEIKNQLTSIVNDYQRYREWEICIDEFILNEIPTRLGF